MSVGMWSFGTEPQANKTVRMEIVWHISIWLKNGLNPKKASLKNLCVNALCNGANNQPCCASSTLQDSTAQENSVTKLNRASLLPEQKSEEADYGNCDRDREDAPNVWVLQSSNPEKVSD